MSSAFRRDMLYVAGKLGWSASLTPGGHYRLTHPQITGSVFCSSSPRKPHRALKNMRGDLMRKMRANNIPIPERR